MKTILLFFLVFLASCNINGSETEEGPVSLRIQNTGNVDFQSVKISFTGSQVHYGELTAGKVSDYKSFEEVYRFGFITVEAESKVYKLVPVDYVGESPLKPGQYTHELEIEMEEMAASSEGQKKEENVFQMLGFPFVNGEPNATGALVKAEGMESCGRNCINLISFNSC